MTYKLTLTKKHCDEKLPMFEVYLKKFDDGCFNSTMNYDIYTIIREGGSLSLHHASSTPIFSRSFVMVSSEREALKRTYQAARAKAVRLSARYDVPLENLVTGRTKNYRRAR